MSFSLRQGLCALLLATAAWPANAAPSGASDRDGDGVIVLAESWWVAARNNGIEYAFIDGSGLAGGGDLVKLEHGRDPLPRLYGGWRLKSSPRTQLGMTFWTYDDRVSGSTPEDPGNVGPLLASPTFQAPPFFLGRVDSATAESELQTTVVDGGVRWSRDRGDHGRLRFDAEVRFFRYERESQVYYAKTTNVVKEVFVNSRVESRGFGPRVAVSYDHRFGRRFGMNAQLGLALPIGTSESSSRQEALEDGSLVSATLAQEPDGTRAFFQTEAEIGFEVRLSQRWAVTLGYGFQFWLDIERTQQFTDVAAQSAATTISEDVVFEGATLGVRYAY